MEAILDLILEGSLEIFGNRKMPLVLRILAGTILIMVYGGLAALGVMLTLSGIQNSEVPLILCGLFLVALVVGFGVMLVRKWHKRT